MKKALLPLFFIINVMTLSAQHGFNYYRDSTKNGSANEKAFTYFKKAYYDCIWKWTTTGADSAEYFLKLAIQEDSNYTAAYAFLAHVYQFKTYKAEDFDKYFVLQKKYAEKAMSFKPTTGDAYSVMSDVAWTQHDTTESLNLLRRAIAMEPDNVGNYIFLAVRFTQIGTANDSAIYYLHRLLQYDPQYGQAYMKLGNIYHWNEHHYDSAKYYYRKAIEHYNSIKPRDARMMAGYSSLADVYAREKKYDSAIHYYSIFLKEMEPSDMYLRAPSLSVAYKALYECYQSSANTMLHQSLEFSKERLAKEPGNAHLMLQILEGNYMMIDIDSVYERYALPLARQLQKVQSSDPNIKIFAIEDEFVILKKLKRNNEALKVLTSAYTKNPKEPIILFDLGRMNIAMDNFAKGLNYLQKAKQNLNELFTKQVFIDQLADPDFDKVRHMELFSKLKE